jgi:hypothetical protein
MSLFDGISSGVRMPDAVMNDGPLPGSAPPFFPAARINYSADLLGDISAYDYGKPTNLSDQTSYLNIPHKIAKIVPQLNLPNANSEVLPPRDTLDSQATHPLTFRAPSP